MSEFLFTTTLPSLISVPRRRARAVRRASSREAASELPDESLPESKHPATSGAIEIGKHAAVACAQEIQGIEAAIRAFASVRVAAARIAPLHEASLSRHSRSDERLNVGRFRLPVHMVRPCASVEAAAKQSHAEEELVFRNRVIAMCGAAVVAPMHTIGAGKSGYPD